MSALWDGRREMIALVATLLAFNMPSYHLAFVKDGALMIAVDDMTQAECLKHVKTFKKTAKARCILTVGQRELT